MVRLAVSAEDNHGKVRFDASTQAVDPKLDIIVEKVDASARAADKRLGLTEEN